MRLVHLFGLAVIVSSIVACGPRQPAEAPAEPAAPAEAPEPAPVTAPEAPAAPAEQTSPTTQAIPGWEIFEIAPGTPPGDSPFPGAPLSEAQLESIWPKSAPDDADALIEEWHQVVEADGIVDRELRLKALGDLLTNLGIEACRPLLEFMGDESQDMMARYYVVLTLEDWVTPAFLPGLDDFVAPDQDAATRSFGTYLIGRMEAPAAIPVLERLNEDEDRRVQFGAQLGLARLRQGTHEEQLQADFYDGSVSPQERAAIAIMFAERNDPLLTDFYLDAAADPALESEARGFCLQALSHIADPSTVPDLQAIADNPALADQFEAAMFAIQQINLHNQGVVEAFPPIQ